MKIDRTDYDRIVGLYREHGSLVKVAQILGITDRTLNRHRKADPDLDARLREAKRQFTQARQEAMPHGTRSKYPHCSAGPDGGKCAACKGANAKHQRELNARRAERRRNRPQGIPHGLGGYMNYGCRCPICSTAKAQANEIYRRRLAAGMVRGRRIA